MGSASLVVASLLLLEEEGGGWEGIQHGFLGEWEEEGAVCPADPQPTSTPSGSPLLRQLVLVDPGENSSHPGSLLIDVSSFMAGFPPFD